MEERIENLKKVINGRPVIVIVHGPSVINLEQRIVGLRTYDICYISLNRFDVIEENILNKIEKKLSVILVSADGEKFFRYNDIINFLERKEDNLYITARTTFDRIARRYLQRNYGKKLLFFEAKEKSENFDETLPNKEYPFNVPPANSLLALIQMVVIAGSMNIFLFGADGSQKKMGEYYKSEIMNEEQEERGKYLERDTLQFNKIMPIVIQNLKKNLGLEANILNVSENSHITTFRKISYDEAFKKIGELGC